MNRSIRNHVISISITFIITIILTFFFSYSPAIAKQDAEITQLKTKNRDLEHQNKKYEEIINDPYQRDIVIKILKQDLSACTDAVNHMIQIPECRSKAEP